MSSAFHQLCPEYNGSLASTATIEKLYYFMPIFCTREVLLNDILVQCLMYADDIVLLSSSLEGLQSRLDTLHKFCENLCLDVNISKTKILVFNKPGRLLKDTLCFNQQPLENIQHYRYLGVFFSASG